MTTVEPLNNLDNITCSICIDEIDLEDKENIKILNCSNNHIFHITCINNWLKINNICPLCREVIISNIQIENIENIENTENTENHNHISCCIYFSCILFSLLLLAIIYFLYYGLSKHNSK